MNRHNNLAGYKSRFDNHPATREGDSHGIPRVLPHGLHATRGVLLGLRSAAREILHGLRRIPDGAVDAPGDRTGDRKSPSNRRHRGPERAGLPSKGSTPPLPKELSS